MNGQIYMITCLPTGKRYIGMTVNSLHVRMKEHLRHARQVRKNKCTYLAHAILKYGPEAFVIENVALADNKEDLASLECEYIARYGDLNMCNGGYSPANTPEIREKIAKTVTDIWKNPEHRAKVSEANSKPVIGTDLVTGEEQWYASAKATGLSNNVASAINGKRKSAGGRTWRYA